MWNGPFPLFNIQCLKPYSDPICRICVYHSHFKCNLRKISEYPNLFGYLRDLYQHNGIAETVNFDHIKRHYYITHDDINPTCIVPLGPIQDLMAPCTERKAL